MTFSLINIPKNLFSIAIFSWNCLDFLVETLINDPEDDARAKEVQNEKTFTQHADKGFKREIKCKWISPKVKRPYLFCELGSIIPITFVAIGGIALSITSYILWKYYNNNSNSNQDPESQVEENKKLISLPKQEINTIEPNITEITKTVSATL